MAMQIRKISVSYVDKNITYDGSQMAQLWAFEKLGMAGDSIVAFSGKMKVMKDSLIDAKDAREAEKKGEKVPISSEKALHFIIEHFDSAELRLAYHRQRVLITIAGEEISKEAKEKVERRGSDLYVNGSKLSVSIASCGNASSKIHLGLNITSNGVPKGVNAVSLEELGIKKDRIKKLALKIAKKYAEEVNEIEEDITKTRCMR